MTEHRRTVRAVTYAMQSPRDQALGDLVILDWRSNVASRAFGISVHQWTFNRRRNAARKYPEWRQPTYR